MADWRWLLGAWGSRRLAVESPLPAEECRRRLTSAVDETEAMFGKLPVVGDIQTEIATLRIRNAMMSSSNFFSSVLRARFEPAGSGTRFDCRLSMSPLARLWLAVWLPALCAVWVFALFKALGEANTVQGNPWGLILGPPGLIVFTLALVAGGRAMAREQDAYLIEYLRKSIDGRLA